MSQLLRYGLILCALLLGSALHAIEIREFQNEEEEARFRYLAAEIRCMVCQNQSLADSDAPLAKDLRTVLLEQIQAGHNDAEIKSFLASRYGDFVLYRPPIQGNTYILWFAPILLLLVGGWVVLRVVQRRGAVLPDEPSVERDYE